MGGIGSGGARVGAGRKRSPRPVCACGAVLSDRRASKCRECVAAARRTGYAAVVCAHCGRKFSPTVAGRRCCSDACTSARLAAVWESRRIPILHRNVLLAERRKRGCSARRNRLKSVGASTRPEPGRWRRICERDGYICGFCLQPVDPTLQPRDRMAPSVDHIVPLAMGGSDDDTNLRPAHISCNSRRGSGIARRASRAA